MGLAQVLIGPLVAAAAFGNAATAEPASPTQVNAITVSSIPEGASVDSETARALSETAGIVFHCSDSEASKWTCEDTAIIAEEIKGSNVTWLTGNQSEYSGTLYVCGEPETVNIDLGDLTAINSSVRDAISVLNQNSADGLCSRTLQVASL